MTAPVNTILCSSSITSADDAVASAQQDQLATLQGLDKFIQARSKLLQDNMNRLPLLQSLQPEFANLAKGLRPDGSAQLTTADNGASVVLPSGIDASLQAELQKVGLSLPTQQRYIVTSETISPSGTVTSPFNAYHVASEAEMTDIAKGTKGTTPGLFGTTLTTSTVTAPNGSRTTYAYNAGVQETVASLLDIQSLNTSIAGSESQVSSDIQSETQDLQQAALRLAQLARVGDAQSTALTDQHSKAQGDLHDQKRVTAFDEVRLRNEDIARFQQDISQKTRG